MAAYHHFDLKKYGKIKYRASDIILAILGFAIVSVLYYLGNFFRLVAGAIFAMLYAIIMNRRILVKSDETHQMPLSDVYLKHIPYGIFSNSMILYKW